MAKKSSKLKTKKTTINKGSQGIRPSVGVILVLVIALVITIVISVCTIQNLKSTNSTIASSKLEVFDHLADSYIYDMEYTAEEDNRPTIKTMTGYGVSDEDGVFYITFDFTPYTVEDHNIIPDGNPRHAIVYFRKDAEHGTYSHTYSYHDDASYHPEGAYVKIEEQE